jgi:hypothetical protein
MLATDLVVGRAYAERAKPNDAECALRKTIFIGPAKAGKAKIRPLFGKIAFPVLMHHADSMS